MTHYQNRQHSIPTAAFASDTKPDAPQADIAFPRFLPLFPDRALKLYHYQALNILDTLHGLAKLPGSGLRRSMQRC